MSAPRGARARGVRAAMAVAWCAGVVVACSSGDATSGAGGDDGGASDGANAADVASGGDDGATNDGSVASSDGAPSDASGCGAFAGDGVFTCSADGNSRGKCVGDASADVEACPRGCLRAHPDDAGALADSVCIGTTTTWSCPGSYGTERAQDGDYYISSFGCWVDADGGVHTDPGDNCIPSCFAKAKAAGLCDPNDTGPECEERVVWYTADAARFGCLQRLRVTNPANGKSLIAVALDFGPACSGEDKVQHAVLDSSGRLDDYLFGTQHGGVDRATVHVVEVDDSYPLGPVP